MAPKTDDEYKDMSVWTYDITLWALNICVDLFFRELYPRGSWKIPRSGPVIFVAAPHANQFIDPLILGRIVRVEGKRRIAFLVAEKSTKRHVIGPFTRAMGAVSVGRAMDLAKSAPGRIYLPDPDGEPTLLRGVGTNFEDPQFQVGGLIALPSVNNTSANTEIAEIVGPEELRLKRAFKGAVAMHQLTGRKIPDEDENDTNGDVEKQETADADFRGSKFKVAPKVDQTKMYDAVHDKLQRGGCIGIFPEGGSHDRTELLPLKAGVAVMALGALAANPDCGLQIVPCGMNYFQAHKFRSRAVIEFGTPVEVPRALVEQYKSGSKREAVSQTLELVYNALMTVTVTSPDYETLMFVQAVRRLYNPKGKKLPLPAVVELNRRLVKGYTKHQNDPRIINLKGGVMSYNKELLAVNVRDHQLEYAKLSIIRVLATLFYRLGKLIILSAAVLPGLILFSPVFIAGKIISIRKSKEALAASSVKIQARDVVATWKLLVSLALAPVLYNFYNVVLAIWTHRNRIQGIVPEWVPLWMVFLFGYILFPSITFAALRFGEIGMDIAKSLPPLILALNPTAGNTLVKLRAKRAQLAAQVSELIEELGPGDLPDFEQNRIVKPDASPTSPSRGRTSGEWFRVSSRDSSPGHDMTSSQASIGGGGAAFSPNIPRNESFGNLANIGLFSSRPQTPSSHSRSSSRPRSSHGFFAGLGGLNAFSTIDSKEALDDVSKRIRGAMKERGKRRLSHDEGHDSDASDEEITPPNEGITMKKNR